MASIFVGILVLHRDARDAVGTRLNHAEQFVARVVEDVVGPVVVEEQHLHAMRRVEHVVLVAPLDHGVDGDRGPVRRGAEKKEKDDCQHRSRFHGDASLVRVRQPKQRPEAASRTLYARRTAVWRPPTTISKS